MTKTSDKKEKPEAEHLINPVRSKTPLASADPFADRTSNGVRCAFCRGRGTDRFGVPSKLSQCQVCQGRGRVYVPEPHEECPACLGTGVYVHHRLTCSVCGGKGRVRKLNRRRDGELCETENKEAIDINTGLPCINAYGLGKIEKYKL